MMTAGVMVAATMRLSSVTELVIGMAKPPVGMYIFYEGKWSRLTNSTDPITSVSGDIVYDINTEYAAVDRVLAGATPEEALWLRERSNQMYDGPGYYDMVWVAPDPDNLFNGPGMAELLV